MDSKLGTIGKLGDIAVGVFPKCCHCDAQFTVDTEVISIEAAVSALCEKCGWGTQLAEFTPSPIQDEDEDG